MDTFVERLELFCIKVRFVLFQIVLYRRFLVGLSYTKFHTLSRTSCHIEHKVRPNPSVRIHSPNLNSILCVGNEIHNSQSSIPGTCSNDISDSGSIKTDDGESVAGNFTVTLQAFHSLPAYTQGGHSFHYCW